MIMGSAIIAVLWIRATNNDRRFDAELWRNEASTLEGSDLRQRMINDLQRNVLTRGMTRGEIGLLLGKQDFGFFPNDYDLVYKLGREPNSGTITRHGSIIRSGGRGQWLALKFNDRDRLVEWRIITR